MHRHMHRIDTWRQAHDNIDGQRLLSLFVTLLLCLEEEFSDKQSTAVFQKLAFTSGVQSGTSLGLHPARKTGYCEAENILCGHPKNGAVFLTVMRLNVPERVILVECSPGEKMKLAFIPLCNKNRQIW
ncbi:hypothetical protein TNCV_3761451 [Trichonephila clavipes]|nr:hypothetical protein TNCV_3761451 [Trichonephila clavipes]